MAVDLALYHRLRSEIPRYHLTSIIVRVASFSLLFTLSIFYALSQPEVFYDQVIWYPSNETNPPYNVTIFRNLTQDWDPGVRASSIGEGWGPNTTILATWNKTGPPTGIGLTDARPCNGILMEKLICKEDQVVASRLGWLDSWPQMKMPKWVQRVVYLDRYIFWTVVVGGALAMGHIVTVLAHSLEPVGVGFLKYCAVVDFLISGVFLFLGIIPLSILEHYELVLPDAEGYDLKTQHSEWGHYRENLENLVFDLEPTQKYAFVMGWALWAFFFVSFLLDFLLIGSLRQYEDIRSKVVINGDDVVPNGAHEMPMPLSEASANTTGYDDGTARSRVGTVSRPAGRMMAPVAESDSVGSQYAVEV